MAPQSSPATSTSSEPSKPEYSAETGATITEAAIESIRQHVNDSIGSPKSKQKIPPKTTNKFSITSNRSYDGILKFNDEVFVLLEKTVEHCHDSSKFEDLFKHARASYRTIKSTTREMRQRIATLRRDRIDNDMDMPVGDSQVSAVKTPSSTLDTNAGWKQLKKLGAILARVEMLPIDGIEEVIERLARKDAPFVGIQHMLRVLDEAILADDDVSTDEDDEGEAGPGTKNRDGARTEDKDKDKDE